MTATVTVIQNEDRWLNVSSKFYGSKIDFKKIFRNTNRGKVSMPVFTCQYVDNEWRSYIEYRVTELHESSVTIYRVLIIGRNVLAPFFNSHPKFQSVYDMTDADFEAFKSYCIASNHYTLPFHASRELTLLHNFFRYVSLVKYEGQIPAPNLEQWDLRQLPTNADNWAIKDLPFPTSYSKSNRKHISFTRITHPWVKQMAKEHAKFLMQLKHSISSIVFKINNLSHLSTFMEGQKLSNLRDFTHKNTLDYVAFLNTLHPTSAFIQKHLSNLRVFCSWGAWMYPDEFPSQPITHPSDVPKGVRKEPEYYTESEIERIKEAIKHTDKMTARIILIMMYCGLRFADIAYTPLNIKNHSCLTKSNNDFVFEYFMPKVKRYNRIPVPEPIANLIKAQINDTRNRFGADCKYLFAIGKNKYYNYEKYYNATHNLAKKYNLQHNGRPMNFITTKLFRSTYATKLLNSNVQPETVRAMLGHTNVYTQMHYATVHSDTMVSLLAPLTKQDNTLIAHIGKVTPAMCNIPDDYSDFVPLPNGSCKCVGDCPHQNACYTCNFYVPEKKFLPTYKLQLEQAELAIKEAQKYKHTAFMSKNASLRDALKTIIATLEDEHHETG